MNERKKIHTYMNTVISDIWQRKDKRQTLQRYFFYIPIFVGFGYF